MSSAPPKPRAGRRSSPARRSAQPSVAAASATGQYPAASAASRSVATVTLSSSPTAQSVSARSSTVKAAEQQVERQQLLESERSLAAGAATQPVAAAGTAVAIVSMVEAPEWVHIPCITGGYRVHHSHRDALGSMFTLHLDTLNIWTHVLGFAWFVGVAPSVYDTLLSRGAPPQDIAYFSICIACTLFQMGASVCYHMFRCMSAEAEAFWLWVDVLGIMAQTAGSYSLMITQVYRCIPYVGLAYELVEALLLALLLYYGRVVAQSGNSRYYFHYYTSCAFAVAFGIIPGTHGLLNFSSPQLFACLVVVVFGTIAIYGGGFLFLATRFPERLVKGALNWVERLVPGGLNIVNSHAVWHVFVWVAGRNVIVSLLDFNGIVLRDGVCPLGGGSLRA